MGEKGRGNGDEAGRSATERNVCGMVGELSSVLRPVLSSSAWNNRISYLISGGERGGVAGLLASLMRMYEPSLNGHGCVRTLRRASFEACCFSCRFMKMHNEYRTLPISIPKPRFGPIIILMELIVQRLSFHTHPGLIIVVLRSITHQTYMVQYVKSPISTGSRHTW